MKKLIILLVLLTTSYVYADTITGYNTDGYYGAFYSYDINYLDYSIMVGVGIKLVGDTVGQSILNTWETGIESIWSTTRFSTPIKFNVDWVDTNYDQQVNVHDSFGRYYMHDWYTGNYWPIQYAAAHEFGHMIGLWDEYSGGMVNPDTGLINTGGLMATLGGTLDYYYNDMLEWYADNVVVEPERNAVPEPMSLFLLGSGLVGFAVIRRKKV